MSLEQYLPAGSELRPPPTTTKIGLWASARRTWQVSTVRRLVFQLFVMGVRTAIWMATIQWANKSDIGDTAGGTEIRLIMFVSLLALSLFMLGEAYVHRMAVVRAVTAIASRSRTLEVLGVGPTYLSSTLRTHADVGSDADAPDSHPLLSAHHDAFHSMTRAHIVTLVLLGRNNTIDDGTDPCNFCVAVNAFLVDRAASGVLAGAPDKRAAAAAPLSELLQAAQDLKSLKTDRMHDALWQHAMIVVSIFFFITPAHYALVFGWWSMLVTPTVGLMLLGPMQLARAIRKPFEPQSAADADAFGYVTIEGDMAVGMVSHSTSMLGCVFGGAKSLVCRLLWCRRASYSEVDAAALDAVVVDARPSSRRGAKRR
jgi:hypothetical protein